MRMIMKASIQTEAGSAAIQDGTMAQLLSRTMDELEAEAAYFYPENGRRTAFIVFDMTDSSRLPVITEPLFSALKAEISLYPAMNVDDVRAGLAALKR
jgi:hypothetical protein